MLHSISPTPNGNGTQPAESQAANFDLFGCEIASPNSAVKTEAKSKRQRPSGNRCRWVGTVA